ncbi:unnamed protein product [Xylocopa violacea]|uniref:Uncharacterized protein n=1 Tax=Xylocopa violacea TaxID=135666 RepID=A0ABP1P090_XYLVO
MGSITDPRFVAYKGTKDDGRGEGKNRLLRNEATRRDATTDPALIVAAIDHRSAKTARRLTGHGHRFHVGYRAHSSDRSGESFLDLLERSASRLGHAEDDENETDENDAAEHPKGPVRSDQRDDILVSFRNDERARPVEGGRDARGRTAYLNRQDLAHHQPRDRAESQGKSDHVNDQAQQWYPTERRYVRSTRLHVEERTEREQGQTHRHTAYVKQHLSTQFVDHRRRDERRDKVNDTHDDGGNVLVDAASSVLKHTSRNDVLFARLERYQRYEQSLCYLKNLDGIEYDRVDSRQLLEEHQAERDQKRFQMTLLEEYHERALRHVAFTFDVQFLDGGQLVGDIGALASQPLQRFSCPLRFPFRDVPSRSFGNGEHQYHERDR